ncbi:hypothetical protein BELL_1129g00040 [Botrytis elliptica]|uniref:ABC transporter domain-containing protein n=1 Tax=Botrytis elliptica TaxID=278938 RepID=A0A4Z1IZU0_9HELO|nr:hypothetical protein BELL_1129g00040 [Botrytis elliptica]
MLEINNRTITIDGINLLRATRNVLRERLNTIPQEPIFIKSPRRPRKLGLWTLISNTGGLDVHMEAESLLSYGQRQIFCLAGAMLRQSKVVIIDQATANVDVGTE